jgi:hypothetical protein
MATAGRAALGVLLLQLLTEQADAGDALVAAVRRGYEELLGVSAGRRWPQEGQRVGWAASEARAPCSLQPAAALSLPRCRCRHPRPALPQGSSGARLAGACPHVRGAGDVEAAVRRLAAPLARLGLGLIDGRGRGGFLSRRHTLFCSRPP